MDATEEALDDGSRVVVISVLDDHARFLLACTACPGETTEATWDTFCHAATAYGLPREVLTDNHLSFTGRLKGFEVEFERRTKAIGVRMINSAPRRPWSRGKIERYHRTLHDRVADHGPVRDLVQLQDVLDAFRDDYNCERPNQAFDPDILTPAERYRPSLIAFDPQLRAAPAYPDGAITRSANRYGVISYLEMKIALGSRWAARVVRIVPNGDRLTIYYGTELIRDFTPDPSRLWQPLPRDRRKKAG